MKVPDVVTLKLLTATSIDLSDVIVEMTVSTGQRNPRILYFPRTDRYGTSALDREDFLGQFEDATLADVMGSWGTIADASSRVQVSLYDPRAIIAARENALAWPLLPHEEKTWASRAAKVSYMATCRNPLFTATPIVVDLDLTNKIELFVAPAHAGAG